MYIYMLGKIKKAKSILISLFVKRKAIFIIYYFLAKYKVIFLFLLEKYRVNNFYYSTKDKIINSYYLIKNKINNFILKYHSLLLNIFIIIFLLSISLIISFNSIIIDNSNLKILNNYNYLIIDDIKSLIFSVVTIIATIIGIVISILLLYIQNISSSYSANIDFFIKRLYVPKYLFTIFFLIIVFNLGLYVNLFNLNLNHLLFYSIFSFLISLYLIWYLYNWSINNFSVLNLSNNLTKDIIKQLIKLNKKIDKNLLKNPGYKPETLVLLGRNVGDWLYSIITFLLDSYSKQIKENQEKVADNIVNNIRLILVNFLFIFKDKFYSYPDLNALLSSNTTFLNLFVEIYLELNRKALVALKDDNYKSINGISNLYKDVILQSMQIDFQGHNPFKDNLILLTSVNSYIDLGKEIIKSNNTECAFRWLDNSKIILVNLIDNNDYGNTENLIKFINQFNKVNNREVLNKLLENYKLIFNYISSLNNDDKLYNLKLIKDNLFTEFSSFIVTLFFQRKENDEYITPIDWEIKEVGNYINIIFDKGTFEDEDIYNLLKNTIESIDMCKELKIDFTNSLGLSYFCNFLLDLYKTTNFIFGYLFFEILYKISIRAYKVDKSSYVPVSNYMNKYIVLSIKNSEEFKIDYYLDTYDKLVKFYNENKCYKLEKNMYHYLGIICYLLYAYGLEYDKLLPLIKDYQNKSNDNLLKSLSVDSIDKVPSHGVPFINTINKKIISLNKKIISLKDERNRRGGMYMYDDFNSSFSDWTINNIDIQKDKIDDFIKLLI